MLKMKRPEGSVVVVKLITAIAFCPFPVTKQSQLPSGEDGCACAWLLRSSAAVRAAAPRNPRRSRLMSSFELFIFKDWFPVVIELELIRSIRRVHRIAMLRRIALIIHRLAPIERRRAVHRTPHRVVALRQ